MLLRLMVGFWFSLYLLLVIESDRLVVPLVEVVEEVVGPGSVGR